MVMERRLIDHEVAFEEYYAMGDGRSLRRLHSQLLQKCNENVMECQVPSLRTLGDWSKKYNWQDRIEELERDVIQKLEKQMATNMVRYRAEHLKAAHAILKTAYEERDGKINPKIVVKNPKDFKDMVDVTQKLSGEPEKIEHSGGVKVQFEVIEGDLEETEEGEERSDIV